MVLQDVAVMSVDANRQVSIIFSVLFFGFLSLLASYKFNCTAAFTVNVTVKVEKSVR